MMFRPTSLPLFSVLLMACGQGSDATHDDGGVVAVDASSQAPPAPKMTPSPSCDRYLACLAATEPSAFPVALQVYKEDGACWDTPATAANCEKACDEGYDLLATHYTDIEECGGCDSGKDPACIPLTSGSYRCRLTSEGSSSKEPCHGLAYSFYVELKSAENDVRGDLHLESEEIEIFDQAASFAFDAAREGGSFVAMTTFEGAVVASCFPDSGRVVYSLDAAGVATAADTFDLTLSFDIKGEDLCYFLSCHDRQTYRCE